MNATIRPQMAIAQRDAQTHSLVTFGAAVPAAEPTPPVLADESAVPVPAPVAPRDAPPVVYPYRRAKNSVVAQCASADGYKTRAGRLAEALGGRWSHRAGGYVMSPRKGERLLHLHAAGWDASIMDRELQPPVPVRAPEITPPVPRTLAEHPLQREICSTQVPEPAQNSPTRARWNASAGVWVPVQAGSAA